MARWPTWRSPRPRASDAVPINIRAAAVALAYLVGFIEVETTPGFLAHGYFTSDPAVSSDLIAMIRYGLAPGAPGRPLEEIQRPFWRIPARP